MSNNELAGEPIPGPSLDLYVEPGAAEMMDSLAVAVGLARVSPRDDVRRVYVPGCCDGWTEEEIG